MEGEKNGPKRGGGGGGGLLLVYLFVYFSTDQGLLSVAQNK